MADTPRGPRPTRTRAVARNLLAGWLVVMLLLVAAAVAPRQLLEDGWTHERVTITNLPYADCDDGTCTMRPTVELPDDSHARARLTVSHPDELLPSNHFFEGGSLLAWVHEDGEEPPRSLHPISATGVRVGSALLMAAVIVGAGLARAARNAPRWHDPRNAGHVADHVAVFGAPVVVLLVGLLLLMVHLQWRTPQHEPTRPAASATQTS